MPSDTYILTISDTGVSIPAPHATSHITGGSDPIPTATSSVSGLMSPAIFNQHTANTAKVGNVTHTGDVTDASGVLTVTKINNVQMSSLATGVVKNTTGTGAPSIAIASDFPTLNQSTTGNALTATTATKATNIAGGATGSLPYQTANDSTALLASGTSGTVLKSNGAAAPSWSAVEKSMLSSALSAEITANTAKVGNVTHTGDVTDASGVLTVTKINNVEMSLLATGIVKNTTATGVPSIAVAADFPTLNQSTTGTAAKATHLAGGSVGSIPYQSAADTTVLLAGTSGTFLKSNGAAAPTWVSIAKTDLSSTLQTEITNAATTAINSTNATNATNLIGGNANSLPYQSATGVTAMLPMSSSGFLKANGLSAPSWSAVTLSDVGGTLSAGSGGTGQSLYSIGDILYANSTTSLAKLPSANTGNVLISGGVGVAPSYNKVGLTTHISGILPLANGGTGTTSGVSLADASGILPVANGGTNVTTSTGTGSVVLSTSPTLVTPVLGTPAAGSILTNCTGLPLTSGVTGVLPVVNGGTGVSQSAYGELYLTTIIETAIAAADTPTKVLGTTTDGFLSNFSHSNGRLTYTGTATRKFYVSVSLSFHGANGTEYSFSVAKDATPIDASKLQATATGPTNLAHVSSQCIIELLTNEFIEVFVENVVDSADVTIDQMNISVFPLL